MQKLQKEVDRLEGEFRVCRLDKTIIVFSSRSFPKIDNLIKNNYIYMCRKEINSNNVCERILCALYTSHIRAHVYKYAMSVYYMGTLLITPVLICFKNSHEFWRMSDEHYYVNFYRSRQSQLSRYGV